MATRKPLKTMNTEKKPISEMSYQEKVEVLAFALSCGMHKNDELKQIEDESYRENIEKLKGNTRGPKSELIAKQSVIRHVFPEPPVLPKWKSFDVLPDGTGICICAKDGLNVYHGYTNRNRLGKLYLGCTNICEDIAFNALEGWMYEHEFQQLINLAL